MTIKDLKELLERATKNELAEVIFIDSKSSRISISSTHMCRHCEADVILSVPIRG